MARQPIVAGQFYEFGPKRLEKQIRECFLSHFGPGRLPSKPKRKKILGAISPHAGYSFSGPAAAQVYKKIAEAEIPDVFIILGVSHYGFRGIYVSLEDWATPLGTVQTDKVLGKELLEEDFAEENNRVHVNEHSIEVQIPFLQFIFKGKKNLKILPIIVGKYDKKLGKFLAKASKNKKICVIASSDFTHYGAGYGFAPFLNNRKKNMYELDKKAIDLIKSLDSSKFLDFAKDQTICGCLPISMAMDFCSEIRAKIKLIKYYTSGDVIKNYSSAVGYAAIIFE